MKNTHSLMRRLVLPLFAFSSPLLYLSCSEFKTSCVINDLDRKEYFHICRMGSSAELKDFITQHKGFDLNILNESGSGAIGLSLFNDDPNVTEVLLVNGANPNNFSESVAPPLCIASGLVMSDKVKLLIKYKANVNIRQHGGTLTPLHAVALAYLSDESAREAVARMLIDAGADLSIKNAVGETPLELAEKMANRWPPKNKKFVEYLKGFVSIEKSTP